MFGDGLMAQAPMGGLGWAFTSRKISFAKWNHLKYANELCSQMALGAAPTVPTASAAGAVPKVSAVEAVEKFLFTDFPTRETFTTKDYEKDAMQTTPEGGGKCFIVHQNI